jgi:hypothetical protein
MNSSAALTSKRPLPTGGRIIRGYKTLSHE